MKIRKNYWLWVALIIVVLLIAKYAISSWQKYQVWEAHKTYFNQAEKDRKIKAWMTPNFIKRHYSLDITPLLGFNPSFWEERKPLNELCQSRQMDCAKLVENFNKINKP